MRIMGDIDRLDREAWLLLLVSGLFATATALSNSFVNVYLWKIKQDWQLISWFNFMHYLVGAITFIIAGWFVKHVDRVIAIRVGVATLSIFYLSVLILGMHSVDYVSWIGALLGLGAGFFWLAFNVMYFEITERENRDIFNGVNGLIGSIAGITAPFISGLVITKVNHFLGYRIIFGISLGIFLAAVVVSFLFKRRMAKGKFELVKVLALIKSPKNHWFWVTLAMIAQGMREGVFGFLIGLLVYVITQNELTLGSFFTVTSLVSLISFYFVGRFMKPTRRNHFIFWGSLMMGVVVLPFVFQVSSWTLFFLGIGAALFYPLFMSPLTSTVFDVIGETEQTAQKRVEYVVSRELAISLGKLISIGFFIYWIGISPDLNQIRWFILMIGFIQMFAWLANRHVPIFQPKKERESLESNQEAVTHPKDTKPQT